MKRILIALFLITGFVYAEGPVIPPGVSQGDFDTLNSTVGGMVPRYASLGITEGTTTNSLSIADTYFIKDGWTVSEADGIDCTTSNITIISDGVYEVLVHTSFAGASNKEIELAMFTNGIIYALNGEWRRKLGSGGDSGSASAGAIITLSAGDIIDVRMQCIGSTADIVIEESDFLVKGISSVSTNAAFVDTIIFNNLTRTPSAGIVNLGDLVYNVKDYGAVGDGATSDVTGFYAAMQDAGTNGGGTVIVPPGIFALGAETPDATYTNQNGSVGNILFKYNNVHLVGSGIGATVIKRVGGATEYGNMFQSIGTTNCSISGMTINGNSNLAVNLTSFEGCNGLNANDAEWRNHFDDGLEYSNGSDFKVSNCSFYDIGANALAFDGDGSMSAFASDLYFNNCGTRNPTNYTIDTHFQGNWAAFQLRNGYFKLNNIEMDNCPTAIQFIGNVLQMSNCDFDGTGGSQTNMYLASGSVFISGFRMTDVGSAGEGIRGAGVESMGAGATQGSGAILYVNNSVIEITGTAIYSTNQLIATSSKISSTTPNHTIKLSGSKNLISSCDIVNNGSSTIRFIGTTSDSIFKGSRFVNGFNFEAGASASIRNLFEGNNFSSGSCWTGGTENKYIDNIFQNAFDINAGTEPSFAEGNTFYDLDFNSSQEWVMMDNIFDLADLAASASQVNTATWDGNKTFSGSPINGNTTKSANYTSDGLDEVVTFNGSSITNFLPDAAEEGIAHGKILTIKNLAAGLVIDGDGADTIDGNAVHSLTINESITIRSDGTNWKIIGSFP